MGITESERQAANRRGALKRAGSPTAIAARYDRRQQRLFVALASGLELRFPPAAVNALAGATANDLAVATISPSGQGIHFPRIDVDLYLPALLQDLLGGSTWMAAQLGREGGRASSPAKASAARCNGRLGGRPRKR